jgi:hypothetical protein
MKNNLDAISEKFSGRDQQAAANLNNARTIASELWKLGAARFGELAHDLEAAMNASVTGRRAFVDEADNDNEKRRAWFRWQILHAAERLNYFADLLDFACWVRLGVVTEKGRSEILLSLHGIGPGYTGLIGASLCFYRRDDNDEGDGQAKDFQVVTTAPFEIYFKDSFGSTTRLFNRWLDNGLNRAVSVWSDGE